ncbi:MAG: SDR family NAD(P)-dependent oxidoreductase [Planctomycetes bacterium]|nr:SDR family NAD(P)-dependent oxidoreductase [Planctomycetota bacterium]
MYDYLRGKAVLVTGGTGSIGSEIVRQVLAQSPAVVRIYSRDENKQYWLESALGQRSDVRYLVGDIREKDRLRRAMKGIEVVFHTAALKQVPSCEYNPFEAVKTNVVGTQNLIEAALEAGCRKVIAVSTDKAINPTSTMGATKLLSERLVATANAWATDTVFSCVRFGNVLNSRGSLVPLAKSQIERGGPVTLTDERMTRFMMPISSAVTLTLEAGGLADGGEIFILKMPALRIRDLLDAVIETYAPTVGIDPAGIKVHKIGVRPGEKLEEELLTGEELPRTTQIKRLLVVHPIHAGIFTPAASIPEALYRSSAAPCLDRSAIISLLYESGALVTGAPLPDKSRVRYEGR